MNIHGKVEFFLNCADLIALNTENKDSVINLIYKTNYKEFSNVSNYKRLKTYWAGRRIKFVIHTTETETKISFVDTTTGDALNLDNPKFVIGNLMAFLEVTPPNQKMYLTIMGENPKDPSMLLLHEEYRHSLVKIHGYSLTDIRNQ